MKTPTTASASPSPSSDLLTLRAMTRGAYDLQKLRMQMGSRICAAFKSKLGIEPGKKEEEQEDEETKKILKQIKDAYKLVTDGIRRELPTMKEFKGNELISTYTELCLVAEYISLQAEEDKHFRRLGLILPNFPIYNLFLEPTDGCGNAMSALIITEIDISKSKYPSSLWKFAGLDVADDGRGRSRRKEHLVMREYTAKDGQKEMRKSITFNPRLKTKLYVLAGCMIKAGNEQYRKIYDNHKHRLESHPKYGIANEAARIKEMKEKFDMKYSPKGHRHSMCLRYMLKIFLINLYNAWRPLEGLIVHPPYDEAKLGKKHDSEE